MSLTNSKLVSLPYGNGAQFTCEIDAGRLIAEPAVPLPNGDDIAELRQALAQPLEFPPLAQALIPGDKVTLALDRGVPHSALLLAEVWKVLAARDVQPEDVTILQPAEQPGATPLDPRSALPADVRQSVAWKVHDPEQVGACRYLATTASGERVYLASDVIDADVVISIGRIAFDPVIGYRGTNSVFYPSLSTADAIGRTQGLGHRELDPEDVRPLRQSMDEVGWLLGTQFSIQVIPSGGRGIFRVIAGACDAVLREGQRLLSDSWLVRLESRPEMIVVAVEGDDAGHRWDQVASAMATARGLVAMGGKILVLTELDGALGEGMQLLSRYEQPRDALQPLKDLAPPDFAEAAQLAYATDWATVYLLSKLPPDLVEDLFMIPVESEAEAVRLLAGDESCVIVGSAQFSFGAIGAP